MMQPRLTGDMAGETADEQGKVDYVPEDWNGELVLASDCWAITWPEGSIRMNSDAV